MKITIKKEVEEIIEVEFPIYVKHGCYLAKVVSVNEVIAVYRDELKTFIIGEHFVAEGYPIERSVFTNAFQSALSKFNQLLKEENLSLYHNWQKEKYGNILSPNGSALPKNTQEEEMMLHEISTREEAHIYHLENPE